MTAWPKSQTGACCKAQPEVKATDGNNIPSKFYRLETQQRSSRLKRTENGPRSGRTFGLADGD